MNRWYVPFRCESSMGGCAGAGDLRGQFALFSWGCGGMSICDRQPVCAGGEGVAQGSKTHPDWMRARLGGLAGAGTFCHWR